MTPLHLSAATLATALGCGRAATLDALHDGRTGLVPARPDEAPRGHVGRIEALATHALPAGLAEYDCRSNRLVDLALRTDGLADALAGALAQYGPGRVGAVIGTSTSGIAEGERAYAARDATGALPPWFRYDQTQDLASPVRYLRAATGLRGPAWMVSVACASSARSLIDGAQLIACGLADAVLVGGVDTLCRTTLHGFAALGLVSASACRPFDVARDGLSLGEAAGFALLERIEGAVAGGRREAGALLLGVGQSSDAHHISAPHPEAAGAIAAMRAALASAGMGPGAVDYVNLHGTATPANDLMEDRAVCAVLGADVPCSSTKGWTGHTLGAAGIVEAIIGMLAIRHEWLPGCLGLSTRDPALGAAVLTQSQAGRPRRVLSNSFGFGGVNCALLLGEAA